MYGHQLQQTPSGGSGVLLQVATSGHCGVKDCGTSLNQPWMLMACPSERVNKTPHYNATTQQWFCKVYKMGRQVALLPAAASTKS